MRRWELSHGNVGVNAPSWLTFEVHRPYFDGAESPSMVIHAWSSVLAARRFDQRSARPLRFGMTMPASYRHLLTEESRLTAYRVSDPTELSDELASPTWRTMSEAYRRHAELDPVDRVGLAHWLIAACLPEAVLRVVPIDLDVDSCQDPHAADLQAARAVALFAVEGLSPRTTAAYTPLVERPAVTLAHVQAVAGWGYLLARHAGDVSAVPFFLGRARKLLTDLGPELSSFQRGVLTVRLALREVMHEERQSRFADARALLSDAQETVAGLSAPHPDDALILLETRRRLLDRQVEIAVRQGDDAAMRRAVAVALELDPWDVKVRMQAAQADERAGAYEHAMAGYLYAARLGPFGTAFALLRAADCARRIGHGEFARVLNERAFRAAPRAGATGSALVGACLSDGDEPLAALTRRAAGSGAERPHHGNWHYRMYGAYFNLGESESPGLYARLPSFAYEFAKRGGRPETNWQRLMPPAFRNNLIRESGLTEFAVDHPADLPPRLRTPAWDQLCAWVAEFSDFDTARRHQVAVVLYRLGFIKKVLELIPAVPIARLSTAAELRLHHWRGTVRYVGSMGSGRVAAPEESAVIAGRPDCPTHLRFVIAVFMVVFHARETRSCEEAAAWRERGARALDELLAEPGWTTFETMMMESRFHRSASYVPFLKRDRSWLARDMDRAEELARAVPAEGEYQEFLKCENLRACLESRSKEAYAFGEDERGHRLVAEALSLDPYEPKTHIERAESLLAQGRPGEAADSALRTARLGPVSTALGYASAAECFRRDGQPVLAEDCFLQALRLDPYAISAARGWAETAGTVGAAGLAQEYLAGLDAWGAARRAARRS
ncbi:hypothetical protein [Streptomyces sp. NPDC058735]|uniref:hypothetical protein n=1 Tax=unclassified Streptomyces TaxID=2593676 RepID=UPI00369BB74B